MSFGTEVKAHARIFELYWINLEVRFLVISVYKKLLHTLSKIKEKKKKRQLLALISSAIFSKSP